MTPPEPAAVRRIARRYRITGRVGSGGMGVVWRAHDELLDVAVAVKELRLLDDDDDDEPAGHGRTSRVDRAIREARNAARLRGNPHVVTVHDAVVDGDRPWIVMDFVDAPSLVAVVREHGPLPAGEVARLGLTVLDAMEYGRDRGVLHCDVKPSNILVAAGGRFLITDFGISGYSADPTVSPDQPTGTPAYMAPERLVGGPATFAADLFSLGATLYYAVAGTGPFHRATVPETIAAVLSDDPAVPAKAAYLWPAISGMLSKKLEGRLGADGARALLDWAARAHGPGQPLDVGVVTRLSAPAPAPAPRPAPRPLSGTPESKPAPAPPPGSPPAPGSAPPSPVPAPAQPVRPPDTSDGGDTPADLLPGPPGLRRARARSRARFAWGSPTHPSAPTPQMGASQVGAGSRAMTPGAAPDPAPGPGPGPGASVEAVPVQLARLAAPAGIGQPFPRQPRRGDQPGWRYRITWRRVVAAGVGFMVVVAAVVGTAWAAGRGGTEPAVGGTVPGGFVGRWHGTVTRGGTGADLTEVSVAVRDGGVGDTVGDVVVDTGNPALRCTAGMVLLQAQGPVLTVRVPAEDATRCGLAHTARLTLHDDGTLGFYVDATHRSEAGGGRLTRS